MARLPVLLVLFSMTGPTPALGFASLWARHATTTATLASANDPADADAPPPGSLRAAVEERLMRSLLDWFVGSDAVAAKHAEHVAGDTALHVMSGSPFAAAPADLKRAFVGSAAGGAVARFMRYERKHASEWKARMIREAAAGEDLDAAAAALRALVGEAPVVLFSFVGCPWCDAAKALLVDEQGLELVVHAPASGGDEAAAASAEGAAASALSSSSSSSSSSEALSSEASPPPRRRRLLVVELEDFGRSGKALRAALADATGRTSMPNAFVGGRSVGGFTDGDPVGALARAGEQPGLRALHERGELARMIDEAHRTPRGAGG